MHLLPPTGRTAAGAGVPDAEPDDRTDIDLERVIWDADYRRQVLEWLRRTQTTPADQPAPEDPAAERLTEQ